MKLLAVNVIMHANKIAELEEALEEEQTIKESLEETFSLELSKIKETHDGTLSMAKALKVKK